MSFKHKKFRVSSVTNANSDINVTPLIDVVLVLLIIFMVVTPLLEKDIEIRVPETEQTDQPEDVAAAQQLIVAITPAGEIFIAGEKIEKSNYVQKLKRMVYAKPAGDRLVFFMPDEKANYGILVTALDGARQAGAEVLGMMTEIPEGMDPNAPTPPEGAPAEGGTPAPPAPPTTP